MSSSPPADPQSPKEQDVQPAEGGGAGDATQAALYNDIFGGDDDDDDLSDEDVPSRPRARLPFPPKNKGGNRANDETQDIDEDEDRDDQDEDDDIDRDEDDYAPAKAAASSKAPKSKRKPVEADEDIDRDEEADGQAERRTVKKKQKKEKRRARTPEDEGENVVQLTEEEERRKRLYEKIDAIGKKPKQVRKKKGGEEDEAVDSYHDEVCERLRERMLAAAERDRESNDKKMPATAKLALLDEAMSILRNTTLWQSILDNGVLEAVRAWLEPIAPTGALPAVGIQKAIFEILPKMELDTQTLKESRLGPIVLFYTKTKRVTPAINRQADALVQAWSRPIIKRPANLRSRYVETADEALENAQRRREEDAEGDVDMDESALPVQQQIKRKRFDTRAVLKETVGRKGARLFVNRDVQYTVAPESQMQHKNEDLNHVSRLQMDNKKYNKFARQMKARG